MSALGAGSGIALRTLQRAVLFHKTYSKRPPASTELSWAHYLALLSLPTAEERAHYESLALQDSLSARQLAAAIQAGQWLDPESAFALERPVTPSYLYAVALQHLVDGDTLVVDVDLGFEVFRRQRLRLAQVDAPELSTEEGRKARDFVASQLLPAQSVVIETRRVDQHGRYVAHLFYSARELSIEDCFTHGPHLNDELLRSGHARLA